MEIDSSYLVEMIIWLGKRQGYFFRFTGRNPDDTGGGGRFGYGFGYKPEFDNITGLDQLKEIVNGVTNASATGRDNIINRTSEMATAALTAGLDQKKAEINAQKEIELAKLKNDSSSSSGGNSSGGSSGSNNSGNGGGAGSSGSSGTSGSAGNGSGSSNGSAGVSSSNVGGVGSGGHSCNDNSDTLPPNSELSGENLEKGTESDVLEKMNLVERMETKMC